MRGRGFVESYEILRTLVQANPQPPPAGPAPIAPGRDAHGRAGAGHEHSRAGRGAHRPGPGPRDAGGAERPQRPAGRPGAGDGLDERPRLGADAAAPSWAPAAGCPASWRWARIAGTSLSSSASTAADDRRLGRLRVRLRAGSAARPVPGAGHPRRLPAGDDQQRPARHRDDHRRGHGPQHHRHRRGQDQGVGRGLASGLRGGGDGPRLRLPGHDERAGHRRRAGLPA